VFSTPIVPKVGLEPTRVLPHRFLSPACLDYGAVDGVEGREQVHDAGYDPGPAGLMAGAEAGPIVAVEKLVEQDAITLV
jgi:hypothetical protein